MLAVCIQGLTVLRWTVFTVFSMYNMQAGNSECGPEVFLLLLMQQMLKLPLNWSKPMYVSDVDSSKNYCIFFWLVRFEFGSEATR